MTKDMRNKEASRLVVQAELDAAKGQAERNRMGQFATPSELAAEILRYAESLLDEAASVRFIDPAIGTGAFYSALLDVFPPGRLASAVGYEVDPHYGLAAAKLWSETSLEVRLEDFTQAQPPSSDEEKFNLLICNPPYVRHHHITHSEKQRLKSHVWETYGVDVSGLAGLYCYFLFLSHTWMADGGLAGWLIPSEFMDVNYGAAVKRYLLEKVRVLQIHRFDPNEVQFGDALVSSSVVWFRKEEPPGDHKIRMTYGGSLSRPRVSRMVASETLRRDRKWTQYPMKARYSDADSPVMSDFFRINRGLVTGSNKFFILSTEEIERRKLPIEEFRPILPSPRYVPDDEVMDDGTGSPVLERRLFLLDCKLPQDEIKTRHPELWEYLEEGKAQGVADRYLCRHREPWYVQEHRPASSFLCTYLGRSDKRNGRPFRFILNHSQATAPNVYLMLYPRKTLNEAIRSDPELKRQVWKFLDGIRPEEMLSEGRVYGGGLHKLEPKELGNVPASALAELLPEPTILRRAKQLGLFEEEDST